MANDRIIAASRLWPVALALVAAVGCSEAVDARCAEPKVSPAATDCDLRVPVAMPLVDPTNLDIRYTIGPNLQRSTDAGLTWTTIGAPVPIVAPTVAPGGILYACQRDAPGVVRFPLAATQGEALPLTVAGQTLLPMQAAALRLVTLAVVSEQQLYALSQNGELYRSSDGGHDWLKPLAPLADRVAALGARVVLWRKLGGELLVSNDGGASFVLSGDKDGIFEIRDLFISPTKGRLLVVARPLLSCPTGPCPGPHGLFLSSDDGATLQSVSAAVDRCGGQTDALGSLGPSDVVWALTADTLAWRSADWGKSFQGFDPVSRRDDGGALAFVGRDSLAAGADRLFFRTTTTELLAGGNAQCVLGGGALGKAALP